MSVSYNKECKQSRRKSWSNQGPLACFAAWWEPVLGSLGGCICSVGQYCLPVQLSNIWLVSGITLAPLHLVAYPAICSSSRRDSTLWLWKEGCRQTHLSGKKSMLTWCFALRYRWPAITMSVLSRVTTANFVMDVHIWRKGLVGFISAAKDCGWCMDLSYISELVVCKGQMWATISLGPTGSTGHGSSWSWWY